MLARTRNRRDFIFIFLSLLLKRSTRCCLELLGIDSVLLIMLFVVSLTEEQREQEEQEEKAEGEEEEKGRRGIRAVS